MRHKIHPQPDLTPRYVSRFWSRVEKTDGCWLWIGGLTPKGYGRFRMWGREYRAHRISYYIATGTYPGDLQVCHSCDVRHCVNPDHLWLGSDFHNMSDMVSKGRHVPAYKPRAERHDMVLACLKDALAGRDGWQARARDLVLLADGARTGAEYLLIVELKHV